MRSDVESWFRRRLHAASDFDAAELAAAKDGRRVSVVLPARDEESTVGDIVSAIRTHLVEPVALVDEIVVVDSDSSDRTAAVAAAAGARVVRQSEVLPGHGNVPGKGEALWKSLAATDGDLLCFVDADLRDFDPSFVVGLLGPLVTDPDLCLVKGCFDRPLDDGRTVLPTGGGRVTELVARPLLDAWWPGLAGFVQPLGGEYAGTRAALESVPFASGYGVDLALLVDLYESRGLDALAQVDLGVRRHRNSDDAALARMAVQIHQTVHARLVAHGRLPADAAPSAELTRFERVPGGAFRPVTDDGTVTDRPPMATVRTPAG